jgi:hypothetical protein
MNSKNELRSSAKGFVRSYARESAIDDQVCTGGMNAGIKCTKPHPSDKRCKKLDEREEASCHAQ